MMIFKNNNPFKIGDKVKLINDDDFIYTIINVYSDDRVSLNLKNYEDVEQDNTIDIKNIRFGVK